MNELDKPPSEHVLRRGMRPLARLDDLLERAADELLSRDACEDLVALSQLFPGRRRIVASVLGHQVSSPAVDALLMLSPAIPGVVEGLYRAFARGVTRVFEAPAHRSPQLIALTFRRTRARQFADYLARATTSLGEGFEQLEHEGVLTYRITVRPANPAARDSLAPPTALPGLACQPGDVPHIAREFQWLHKRLAKLRHTGLWINGWSLADGSAAPQTAAVQVHLVRAFFDSLARPTQMH